jgi:Domain of unknown function (DUF4157)/Transglycosylase SLT domain
MSAPEEDKDKIHKKGKPEEEDKKVQRMSAPEEDKDKIHKKGKPEEEDKKVQRMSAPEEDKDKSHKKGKPEEEEKVQRKCAECEEEEHGQVQRKSDGSGTAPSGVTQQIENSKGRGSKLSDATRSQMESSFGTDFSNVTIHTDRESADMNNALHAQAFTHGSDIYFNEGKYNPQNTEGGRLLAHELTHVVQQNPENALNLKPKPKPKPKAKTKPKAFDEIQTLVAANNQSTLSTEILTCQIWKESGFVHDQKNKSSSATGLMQMTKAAVDTVNNNTPKGVHFTHGEMTDPSKNIECATYYIKILMKTRNLSETDALNSFGTGAGYSDNLVVCETCLKDATDEAAKTACLHAIHK